MCMLDAPHSALCSEVASKTFTLNRAKTRHDLMEASEQQVKIYSVLNSHMLHERMSRVTRHGGWRWRVCVCVGGRQVVKTFPANRTWHRTWQNKWLETCSNNAVMLLTSHHHTACLATNNGRTRREWERSIRNCMVETIQSFKRGITCGCSWKRKRLKFFSLLTIFLLRGRFLLAFSCSGHVHHVSLTRSTHE